jgi:hypothetical protein
LNIFVFSILSGPQHYQGIFVEKVKAGSLAEEVGLEVGDQIVEVNETSFVGISHNEVLGCVVHFALLYPLVSGRYHCHQDHHSG